MDRYEDKPAVAIFNFWEEGQVGYFSSTEPRELRVLACESYIHILHQYIDADYLNGIDHFDFLSFDLGIH